jgi:amidophosphoribosyltransferase
MPTRKELIAYGRNDNQVAAEIGADQVIYQDVQDLMDSVTKLKPEMKTFDMSVFNGDYVTGQISEQYLESIERQRSESTRMNKSNEVIGLFNSRLLK